MGDPAANGGTATPDTVVIGAGVNGLSIAWRLAQGGCRVRVFDAGPVGGGASWASAGMLAAAAEAEPGEEKLTALGRASQGLWPRFAAELHAAGGIDPEYRESGLLVAAMTRGERDRLAWTHRYQRDQGLPVAWLSPGEVSRREPRLRSGVMAGLRSPEDHRVNNRALTRALEGAARNAGVAIHPHAPVEAVVTDERAARGVRVAGEWVPADAVVLAAGAWSRTVAGLPEAAQPPVRPVKGQMLSLRMDPDAPLLRHVVWAPTVYLVPRDDGTLVIGGTVEENGFDTTVTAGGLYALLQAAWRAMPAIEELPVSETWVGFRPTSRDDAPILGPSGVDGLWLATGHHRNGILLAPLTADAVSAAVLGREAPVDGLAAFGLARFRASATEAG